MSTDCAFGGVKDLPVDTLASIVSSQPRSSDNLSSMSDDIIPADRTLNLHLATVESLPTTSCPLVSHSVTVSDIPQIHPNITQDRSLTQSTIHTSRLSYDRFSGTDTNKGVCSVCKFAFSLTKAGKLYPHGGRGKDRKCEGTGKYPLSPDSLYHSSSAPDISVSTSQTHIPGSSQTASSQDYSSKLWQYLSHGVTTVNRIPKGARQSCRDSLITVLNAVSSNPNDSLAWANLLAFAPGILYKPTRGVALGNLTKAIKSRAATITGIFDLKEQIESRLSNHKRKDH